jgi:hypothetical protein
MTEQPYSWTDDIIDLSRIAVALTISIAFILYCVILNLHVLLGKKLYAVIPINQSRALAEQRVILSTKSDTMQRTAEGYNGFGPE